MLLGIILTPARCTVWIRSVSWLISVIVIIMITIIIIISSSSSTTTIIIITTTTITITTIIIIIITITITVSLIADSSDKSSHGRQNKSNIESKVTLQILSAVDSKGKNIGARKFQRHNVTTIVRNGRFVRPDHWTAVTTR